MSVDTINVIDTVMSHRHRLIAIDGHGRLHPAQGEPLDLVGDELFAIAVIWDSEDGTAWTGWLTTTTGRSVCFASADLEDPIFQSWLRALPGWEHTKLWQATTNHGTHLVWRRPES